jgi:hypothetical protein
MEEPQARPSKNVILQVTEDHFARATGEDTKSVALSVAVGNGTEPNTVATPEEPTNENADCSLIQPNSMACSRECTYLVGVTGLEPVTPSL